MTSSGAGGTDAGASSGARPQRDQANGGRPYIGGQAVLEGVMMRAPTSFAVAVRLRDGSLILRERAMEPGTAGGMRRWPFARGLASMVESLRLGSEALRFSAEQMEAEVREGEPAGDASAGSILAGAAATTKGASARAKGSAGQVAGAVMRALTMTLLSLVTRGDGEDASAPAVGVRSASAADEAKPSGRGGATALMLVVAITFLIALPQAAAAAMNRLAHWDFELQSPAFQALTGVFKLTIVVGYLLLIRRVPDIRRVFQYHGAEHMTISTYEAGEPLVVANARAKTTLHPRCGTTFLVMVALVSILVFTAVGGLLPRIHTGNVLADNVIFFLEKLPFIPFIAGITFELQRLFARHCTTGPLRLLLLPGFAVQKVTTIEPDDAQLEVALASLRATLVREKGGDLKEASVRAGATVHPSGELVFPSYDAVCALG